MCTSENGGDICCTDISFYRKCIIKSKGIYKHGYNTEDKTLWTKKINDCVNVIDISLF